MDAVEKTRQQTPMAATPDSRLEREIGARLFEQLTPDADLLA
jgi:hypothetical protein